MSKLQRTRAELIDEFNTMVGGLIRLRDGIYASHVESTGLSLMQITALSAIYEYGSDVSVGQVGDQIGAPPSTMTSATNKLVSLGYIERFTPPENRRAVVLRCTEAGIAVARMVSKEDQAHVDTMFEGMTDDDLAELTRLFGKLEVNVRKMMAEKLRRT